MSTPEESAKVLFDNYLITWRLTHGVAEGPITDEELDPDEVDAPIEEQIGVSRAPKAFRKKF